MGEREINMNTHMHNIDSLAGFAAPFDQNLISQTEYNMLRNHGLLPTYARNWIQREFGGVPSRVRRELIAVAKEQEYHPELAISIVFGVISSHKSLQKWVQANLRKSHQSVSVSAKANGKWVDMEATLWPPYERPATRSGLVNNTVYHRPARYVFKHGDIRVDLGAQDGRFSPIMHNNPNSAMQSIATRLGRAIGGDWNTVAQKIVGNDDLIATSTSLRVGNQWVVLISMMRNPKVTPSSYHVTMEGNVVSQDPHHPANSVSETEYALIKGIVEEEDEHSTDYSYEFDEDKQAQMLVEAMSDKLDADTFTPTELLVMELAAENGDLIDFMSGAATYQSQDYHDILDERVEQTALRLITKYEGNVDKAFYVARMIYQDDYDALEATQAYCIGSNEEKSFFSMRGSRIARVRFFGMPSAYETAPFLPARNPVKQTEFLPMTEYIPPTQKFSEPSGFPTEKSTKIAYFCGKPKSVCVNKHGQKAIAPDKKPTQFSLQNHPRLNAIVSALALTGSLPKALKVNKRKESFA
jgi:hypothetical protein